MSEIRSGIFHLNNEPKFVISGDYPYYRDSPDFWEDRLIKMKNSGIEIVTFYVPWRHHFIKFDEKNKQDCDFTGGTQPNRNVVLFIKLIHKLGLFACVKPGPFIHAETNYGGLPDFVHPDSNRKISPQRNHLALKGYDVLSKNRWMPYSGKTLPSPLDPEFLRLTKEYYQLVGKYVLDGAIYPMGPVVLLQFLNEGLYSAGRMPYYYSGDYTPHNLRLYRDFLKKRYNSIQNYNTVNLTSHSLFDDILPPTLFKKSNNYKNLKDLHSVIDWNDYGIYYYSNWVNELKKSMKNDLSEKEIPPLIANWNPPGDFCQGLDVWATRVDIESIKKYSGVNYGYTNWIGAVNYRKSSYLRYSFLCGRAPGVNMEENWGFAKMYDKEYKRGYTPLFQTLLAIASGGTGYNVYTAVGTAHWDDNIDDGHERPYPSDSPIDEKGRLTNKYYLMAGLNKYFSEYFGKEFFECSQDQIFTLGLYQPYIQLAAFAEEDIRIWKKIKAGEGPVFGMDGLSLFHMVMRKLKLGYNIINLETVSFEQEMNYSKDSQKVLVFFSGIFLAEKVQEKLKKFILDGGILYLIGDIPEYDVHYNKCTIFKDSIISQSTKQVINRIQKNVAHPIKIGKGLLIYQKGNPFRQRRTFKSFLLKLLAKFLMKIRIKIPFKPMMVGATLPYSEIIGMIGGDGINPKLDSNVLNSTEKLLRYLEKRGVSRTVDIEVNTEAGFENDIDVFLFKHPKQDIQHIFLFNLSKKVLPISLNYYIHQYNRRVNLYTEVVCNTAQLIRVENGKFTSLIYTSYNPNRNIRNSLNLKINKERISTNKPIDISILKREKNYNIITSNGSSDSNIILNGLGHDKISLNTKEMKSLDF